MTQLVCFYNDNNYLSKTTNISLSKMLLNKIKPKNILIKKKMKNEKENDAGQTVISQISGTYERFICFYQFPSVKRDFTVTKNTICTPCCCFILYVKVFVFVFSCIHTYIIYVCMCIRVCSFFYNFYYLLALWFPTSLLPSLILFSRGNIFTL